MNWDIISNLMTAIGIPAIGLFLAYREKKSEKRQTAQTQYNMLMLEGQERTGSLAAANAKTIINYQMENSREELEEELKRYEEFRDRVNTFKRQQTAETVK